jgi:large subunit ribosomal protein L18
MAKVSTIPYQRKKKTDYKTRLKLLMAKQPRLVVRPTLHHTIVQAVEYHEDGDKIIAHAHTAELKGFGWDFSTGNIPAAYLAGFLLGKRLKGKVEMIPDLGPRTKVKGSKLYAALKGAIDAGVQLPHDPSVFPNEDRLNGKHIAVHGEKSDKKELADITSAFTKVKKAIEEGPDGKARK